MNIAIIAGTLGRDPELNYTQNGTAICRMSIATNRKVKRGDEWQDETEWHRVTVWGKFGQACADNLRKGQIVTIQGRIHYDSYETKEGEKRYTTEIVAEDIKWPRRERGSNEGRQGRGNGNRAEQGQWGQSGGDHGGWER